MKVILLEDVKGQGKAGDLINVSDGHARNFLIPRKLAAEANAQNMAAHKQQKAKQAKQLEKEIANAKALKGQLGTLSVKVTARGGEGGRLFGAVTGAEIVEALKKQHGIALEKNKLVQDAPIKTFGEHEVKVKLGHELSGVIQVVVESA